ncbi:MAG: hypothetical protein M1529_05630, partial [Candidatus Thermoplasmatota archaeon]|nr:hypothetical protein [Candidatus Thermoplasmatota archaeon]
ILVVGTHFVRGKSLTIFELSLLGSWRRLAVSKIIAFSIGLLPFIVVEILLLWLSKNVLFIAPILTSFLVYSALSILSSLSSSQLTAFTIGLIFILLIPISAVVLLENLGSLGATSGTPLGIILYLIVPLASFEYYRNGVVSVYPLMGFSIAFIISVIMIFTYILLFQRQEFKP